MSVNPWDLPTIDAAEAHLRQPGFSPFTLDNLINGSFPNNTTGSYIDSVNPKTGQLVAKLPNSSPEELNNAVEAAHRAFPSWAATGPSQRSMYIRRIVKLIEERRELFAVWESIDQGKTLARARAEIDRAVANFRYLYTTSCI